MDPVTIVAVVAAAALAGIIVGYVIGRVWPRRHIAPPRRAYRVTVTAGADPVDDER